MQREERILDTTVDAIIQRVTDMKTSLQHLIMKMETCGESADWPQYLDSFSVISAQIFSLLKILKSEKTPLLRNYLTLPLTLKAENDDQLLKLTQNRVPSFSHDFVPNLLRTKPEPEVEAKLIGLENKAALCNQDTAIKLITAHNKIVKNVLEVLNHSKEEWESDTASRLNQLQTHSVNETQSLAAAIGMGKGIKMIPTRPPQPSPSLTNQQAQQPQQPQTAPKTQIKTNIKAAHPYSR